jgi:hypothetical protein
VVASFAVFNSVYPAVQRSSQAISDAANTVNGQMTSQIQIIEVSENGTEVDAWVKNVGSTIIGGIEYSDVFFGLNGEIGRVSFGDNSSAEPYWSYQMEGDNSMWTQATTNEITIHLTTPLARGVYLLKFVIPNGVFDETSFSVE